MPPTASVGHQRERYRLDDLTVDVGACRLRRGDEEISLPKLSFDFLTALIRRAPDMVTTDELMDAVWGGTVVSDETVTQRAKLLRDALGGGPRNVQYEETVRGRGYRLAVSVEPAPTTAQTPGFLAELARRRIPQVAGGYAVVGWIVLQVADIVVPELRLPEWTVRAILLALVAGFPIVLVLAWTFQITPEGGLGRIEEARQQLELLLAPPPPNRLDPMSIVKVLTALGEYDRAFEWLERAVQEGCDRIENVLGDILDGR